MSQPDSELNRPAGILVPKPRSSAYTLLLGVAAIAMSIGCLALLMEWARYGFQYKP